MTKWKLVPVDCWRELEPYLGKDVPNREVVLLSDVKGVLAAPQPPAPSVPDGWRIVPYTPTVQMLERAAYAVNNRPQPSKYEPSATPAIIFWNAMLNYAPEAVFINSCSKPPKLSDERILELFAEHSRQYNWPLGFARAIEREILGGGHE